MRNTLPKNLCRDCFNIFSDNLRCDKCNSPRVISHSELFTLKIAHIDCDAFYASIEKNDFPHLRNLPVIVGGAKRGVVTTCCYIARISGVRSAMPMFQAKKLCPNAIIIAPRMSYYKKVSASIKEKLLALSPAIEFVALDEAYIDLTGTERLHRQPAAVLLAKIANDIESVFGITISIGLSYNKFLSKMGSELEKPRGFSIIGQLDAKRVLKNKPICKILGVGKKTQRDLQGKGINVIGDILRYDRNYLKNMFGDFGENLWFLAQGIDDRKIAPNKPSKSISAERTFQNDETDFKVIRSYLWELVEKISWRLKNEGLVAARFSLKLKSKNFKLTQRSRIIRCPTNLAETIFQESVLLLEENMSKGPFRLIGITLTHFSYPITGGWKTNLLENNNQLIFAEAAIDEIREKFGESSIVKGRSLRKF